MNDRFAKDDINFSINSDDPILTGRSLSGDYEMASHEIGLTDYQLIKAVGETFNRSLLLTKQFNILSKMYVYVVILS